MKNKYPFLGNEKITATLVVDNIIWIAFYGIDGVCKLYGCNVYDLDVIYWDIDITASEITSMTEVEGYIYLALDNNSNICAEISTSNPTDVWYLEKDLGINEKAIDVVFDSVSNQVYFLIPGAISGENAKITVYDWNDEYVETIDLTTVFDASKISSDEEGTLWVLSNLDTTPIITKVEQISEEWDFTNYTLS